MSAAKRRSTEVLAVEVDGLHAWLAAAVAAIVDDRQARGLPVPAGLYNPAAWPAEQEAAESRSRTSERQRRIQASGFRVVRDGEREAEAG